METPRTKCDHCIHLSAHEETSGSFAVTSFGTPQVPTVMSREHDLKLSASEKRAALIALKIVACQRFGSMYFIEVVCNEPHWVAVAKKLARSRT